MLKEISRTRLMSVWFTAVALIGASTVAMGVNLSIGPTALLVTMSLVPPAIMLALWRRAPALTAREIMYSADTPKQGRP